MISETVLIKNPLGLHARPASNFSKLAAKFKSDIKIIKDDKKLNAKSVLLVMSAGVKCGMEIVLTCDGVDEQEAMQALVAAIDAGLGE